jgi:hypothetical protein
VKVFLAFASSSAFAFAANFLLRGLLPKHGSDNHQGYSNERSTVDAGFQR